MSKVMLTQLLLLVVALCSIPVQIDGLGCKSYDENGNLQDVDWFLLYKIPMSRKDSTETNKDGKKFVYASSVHTSWQLGEDISSSNNPLAATLLQTGVYKESYSYNDQRPTLTPALNISENSDILATYAHTKGFIGLAQSGIAGSGYWIIHSIPKWFMNTGPYAYPANGFKNGQIAFCMSLSTDYFDNLSNTVRVYLSWVNPMCLINGNTHTSCVQQEIGLGYQRIEMTSYVKVSQPGSQIAPEFFIRNGGASVSRNIYQDVLGSVGVTVQTWRPTLGSSEDSTANCENMKLTVGRSPNIQTFTWKGGYTAQVGGRVSGRGVDHSKWATNAASVCIGDLNKFNCKTLRDGGIFCFQNNEVRGLLNSLKTTDTIGESGDDTANDDPQDECEEPGLE